MRNTKSFATGAVLAMLSAAPLQAQTPPDRPDPLIQSMHEGAAYVRALFTTAADQMDEEDYTFRPTPDVRSFGQLLAHVAGSNYVFCAAARGEAPPVQEVEQTSTTREAIRNVLAASFAYCEEAHDLPAAADTTVPFMGQQRSPNVVLNFRLYHSLLHYGNVVTYMRLRGKVPPSSQPMQPE